MNAYEITNAGIISRAILLLHHDSERLAALASVLRVLKDAAPCPEAEETLDLSIADLEQLAREAREPEAEEREEHERATRTSARYRRAHSEGVL